MTPIAGQPDARRTGGRSLAELGSLRGRVALVTGGAGHLGSALCHALAEQGASIAIADVAGDAAAALAQAVAAEWGVEAASFPVDLADESALRMLPRVVSERFSRLDVLVNCAALVGTSDLTGWVGPFEKQSSAAWRRALEINLTVPFVLTQACAELLREHSRGSVINIGSIYGIVGPDMRLYEGTPLGNPAAYAASKGGLVQLTRWLATVLAPKVRVNSVSLGGIERGQPKTFVERYEARVPMRRMATEEDIKGAVAYLAGDASAYVSGQNLIVDGGWTAW